MTRIPHMNIIHTLVTLLASHHSTHRRKGEIEKMNARIRDEKMSSGRVFWGEKREGRNRKKKKKKHMSLPSSNSFSSCPSFFHLLVDPGLAVGLPVDDIAAEPESNLLCCRLLTIRAVHDVAVHKRCMRECYQKCRDVYESIACVG